MKWHNIHLINEENISLKQSEIGDQFFAIFTMNGSQKGMALFSLVTVDGSVDIFVTPDASNVSIEIINQLKGVPCEKPDMTKVSLLRGIQGAKELF